MALFKRAILHSSNSLPRKAGPGEGIVANPRIFLVDTDANFVLSLAMISGGAVQQAGNLSAPRTVTTFSAADLIAACPDMDIGDSFMFMFSSLSSPVLTLAAGAGVTLLGRPGAGNGNLPVVVTRTGPATISFHGL